MLEWNIKILNTNNYKEFEESILRSYSLYLSIDKNISIQRDYYIDVLYGPAGSGKTTYKDILKERLGDKFNINYKEIKDLNIKNVLCDFLIIDSLNEKSISLNDVLIFAKKWKIFILVIDWVKLRSVEERNVSWIEIQPNIFGTLPKKMISIYLSPNYYHFSAREIMIMSNNKKLVSLSRKQPHVIIWKCFQNILKNKKIKERYKYHASKDPIKVNISKDNNEDIILIAKHFIQYNNEKEQYIFSHSNVSSHLYFREIIGSIRKWEYNNFQKSIIKKFPENFLNWVKVLNIERNKVLKLFESLKIKVSAYSWLKLYNETELSVPLFKKLNIFDISELVELKYFQTIYKFILNENIKTIIDFPYEYIKPYDISLLANYLNQYLYRIEDNNMCWHLLKNSIKTNFQSQIGIDNSTKRKQMINFVFFRTINFYYDSSISALNKSNLKNKLFCKWDSENTLTLIDFVTNKYRKFFNNSVEVRKFDSFLNSSISRSPILEGSRIYKTIDKRFNTSRNALGYSIYSIGHKYVNYWVATEFESNLINITLNTPVFEQNYKAIELGEGFGKEYPNNLVESPYFVHFIILMFQETITSDSFKPKPNMKYANINYNFFWRKLF